MRAPGDNLVKRWWRQLAFDLPRARNNAMSRRRVVGILLSILFSLAGLSAVIVPIAWVELRFAGRRWGSLLLALTLYALLLVVRRWIGRGMAPVTLGVHATRSPGLREGLLQHRTILSSLVDRGEFELRWSQADLRPEGGIRARIIEHLRHRRMWDKVPLPLQNLLSEPEGSWSCERIRRVLLQVEAVRVLAWAIEEEERLPSLRTMTEASRDVVRRALEHHDRGAEALYLRHWTEVDTQIAATRVYLSRLRNELIKRRVTGGTFDADMEERMAAYMVNAAETGEVEVVAEDLPLGQGLVSEAASAKLLEVQALASVRFLTLETLREAVSSGSAVGFEEQNRWITEKLTLHMRDGATV